MRMPKPSNVLQIQGEVWRNGAIRCAQVESFGRRERKAKEVIGRANAG